MIKEGAEKMAKYWGKFTVKGAPSPLFPQLNQHRLPLNCPNYIPHAQGLISNY